MNMECSSVSRKTNQNGGPTDFVYLDLPAPPLWKKMLVLKQGGTPRTNEIKFVAPTGEEIKHKKQLEQYLKLHPGNPGLSEFDWGTGETPRRSARISSKAKVAPPPADREPPKKRGRQYSSSTKNDSREMVAPTEGAEGVKQGAMQNVEVFGRNENKEMHVPTEGTVEVKEVEMLDAEAVMNTNVKMEAGAQETKVIKDVEMQDAEATQEEDTDNGKKQEDEDVAKDNVIGEGNKSHEQATEESSLQVEVGMSVTDGMPEVHKPSDGAGGTGVNADQLNHDVENKVILKVENLPTESGVDGKEKHQAEAESDGREKQSDENMKPQREAVNDEKVKAQIEVYSDKKEQGPATTIVETSNGFGTEVLKDMASLLKGAQENDDKANVKVEVKVKKLDGEALDDGKVNRPLHHQSATPVSC